MFFHPISEGTFTIWGVWGMVFFILDILARIIGRAIESFIEVLSPLAESLGIIPIIGLTFLIALIAYLTWKPVSPEGGPNINPTSAIGSAFAVGLAGLVVLVLYLFDLGVYAVVFGVVFIIFLIDGLATRQRG